MKSFIDRMLEIPETQQVTMELKLTPRLGCYENKCFENTTHFIGNRKDLIKIPCWTIYEPDTVIRKGYLPGQVLRTGENEYQAEAHSIVYSKKKRLYMDITPGYRGQTKRTVLLETRMNAKDFGRVYNCFLQNGGNKCIPIFNNLKFGKPQQKFLCIMRAMMRINHGEEERDNYD